MTSNDYAVRPVSYEIAREMVLSVHYSRTMPTVCYAFGLFHEGRVVGVVTYGIPASPSLCVGVAGRDNRHRVLELNRLAIVPGLQEKNLASMLVGRSLRMLPKGLIIVSYADAGEWGHVGYVYQATNFIYTGKTQERTDIFSAGGHSRHHLPNETRRQPRSAKHRYVFVTGHDKRLIASIRYEKQPYPKGDSRHYETDNPVSVSGIHKAQETQPSPQLDFSF